MEDAFENFIDHAEMILAGLKLLLEIDEVGGHGIKAEGEEAGDVEIDFGVFLEEGFRVFDDVEGGWFEGADRGHVSPSEEDGDFAEDGTGGGDDVDLGILLQNLDGAFLENEKGFTFVVFGEDIFAFGDLAFGKSGTDFKGGFHGQAKDRACFRYSYCITWRAEQCGNMPQGSGCQRKLVCLSGVR
jgi:hypothetical protein